MAEQKRKFAALADLNQPLHEPEAAAAAAAPVTIATAEPLAEKARGRPATGKRSNPEWKLYSHFLKRKTHKAAVARLQDEEDERDLSDVLEELLQRWLKS